jgi:hypothetical protein
MREVCRVEWSKTTAVTKGINPESLIREEWIPAHGDHGQGAQNAKPADDECTLPGSQSSRSVVNDEPSSMANRNDVSPEHQE